MQRNQSTRNKKGFTLIELLVVVSIIALLVSILMPALGKAREAAKRAVCSTRLHQWGIVLASYSNDNKDKVPVSANPYTFGTDIGKPEGDKIALFNQVLVSDTPEGDAGGIFKGMFAVNLIEPYIPGIDTDTNHVEEDSLWTCPSFQTGLINYQDTALFTSLNPPPYFHFDYCYYAGASRWKNSIDRSRDLTDRVMEGKKVIMSDQLWTWFPDGPQWAFNHGTRGPSSALSWMETPPLRGTPETVTGVHRLYGDGSVHWETKNGQELEDLVPSNMQEAESWVNSQGTYYFY